MKRRSLVGVLLLVASGGHESANAIEMNPALGQCRIVRANAMMVPTWRDNGVTVQKATDNVLSPLLAFGPSNMEMERWRDYVAAVYAGGMDQGAVDRKFESLCKRFEGLNIPTPLP